MPEQVSQPQITPNQPVQINKSKSGSKKPIIFAVCGVLAFLFLVCGAMITAVSIPTILAVQKQVRDSEKLSAIELVRNEMANYYVMEQLEPGIFNDAECIEGPDGSSRTVYIADKQDCTKPKPVSLERNYTLNEVDSCSTTTKPKRIDYMLKDSSIKVCLEGGKVYTLNYK